MVAPPIVINNFCWFSILLQLLSLLVSIKWSWLSERRRWTIQYLEKLPADFAHFPAHQYQFAHAAHRRHLLNFKKHTNVMQNIWHLPSTFVPLSEFCGTLKCAEMLFMFINPVHAIMHVRQCGHRFPAWLDIRDQSAILDSLRWFKSILYDPKPAANPVHVYIMLEYVNRSMGWTLRCFNYYLSTPLIPQTTSKLLLK